jgi:hypothetical protein
VIVKWAIKETVSFFPFLCSYSELSCSGTSSCKLIKFTIHLQVAERQGKYLLELFNKIGKHGGKALSAKDIPLGDPFVYQHLGSMASVGRYKALVDLRQSKVP